MSLLEIQRYFINLPRRNGMKFNTFSELQ